MQGCRLPSARGFLLPSVIVVSSTVAPATFRHAPCHQRRWQSFAGEQRTTARRSKQGYSHPLAPKDPATRNIVIPDTVHAKAGSSAALSAEMLQKRAQRALLLQLQQNIIWEGTVINDQRHHLIEHFTKLRQNPKYRCSKQMMIVGGKEILRELFDQGYTPRHLLLREGHDAPEWSKRKGVKTEVVRVDRRIAEACVPGNDGFIGDFNIPEPPPKEHLISNKQRFERVLVLDNVDDPGLLGTMLRTAAAFHYDVVITTNHCADLYDHRVVRAARGAHFQKAVPFYCLKEEDGEDVYGMLNHIVQRNNLSPVCFTPVNDDVDSNGETISTLVKSLGCDDASLLAGRFTKNTRCVGQETLNSYCCSRFTSELATGQLLILGPNQKRNSVRRWARHISVPMIQLLLDEVPCTDSLVSFSIVLSALRPHGNWDYLPACNDSSGDVSASFDLQTKRASVDIGANRYDLNENDLNLDEEEQIEKARLKNEFMKWKRLQGAKLSDYEHWMEAETKRIQEMASNERQRRRAPWKLPIWRWQKGAAGMPVAIPNIIDEYRMPLDRDALRTEKEISEKYIRPENYDM
ncbi:putative SpoU rRNA Methylase family [Trypanosoma vivax]|uniref:tRNA/rRNA methyltransferase SpoU type domain-containing protein n=1 Tax=Trypanosoma vivax (strain Y486) TaxID=1055687 RepID=G0U3F0_TRYVY|nr:hypothetical protein TRVL_00525 [Trypanosoma vivax]KAH8614284.1 putative SpoU rRNA Methylase family [Trypanosoma vivax]CCC50807.1 conserved hypothetical protein [Trypanosoma vivax Y486]